MDSAQILDGLLVPLDYAITQSKAEKENGRFCERSMWFREFIHAAPSGFEY